MAHFTAECPHCQAHLQVKDRKYVGKRVKCPRCKEPFVVQAPASGGAQPRKRRVSADAPVEEPEQSGELPPPVKSPAPKKSRRRGTHRGKSRPKRDAASWKKPALIGGSAAALLVLIVAVFLLMNNGSDEPPAVDLAYLPQDAEVIVAVRVADLWNAPLAQKLFGDAGPDGQQAIEKMQEKIGMAPADIDSVILAIRNASGAVSAGMGRVMGAGPMGVPPGLGAEGPDGKAAAPSATGVAVIRTRKAYDREKLLAQAAKQESAEHEGKTYFRVSFPANPQPLAVHFADEKTIVMGTEEELKAAIVRGGESPPLPAELKAIDPQFHLAVAFHPSAETRQQATSGGFIPGRKATDAEGSAADEISKLLEDNVDGLGLTLQITDALAAQVFLPCKTEQGAQQISTALQGQLEQARTAFSGQKDSFPPPLFQALEQALASVKSSQQTDVVALTGSLPASFFERDTLASIPMLVMSMMMAGMADGMTEGMPKGMPTTGMEGMPGNEDFGVFMQDDEPAPPMEAVTLDEFNASWQANIGVKDEPAGEVLNRLLGELELSLKSQGDLDTALKKPVTVNLQGASRLQAIEDVCRQVDIHPRYSPKSVSFEQGPRAHPVAFAGPFVIEVLDVREFVPHATGQIKVRVFGSGLPAAVFRQLEETHKARIVGFRQIADAKGSSLLDRDGNGGGLMPEIIGSTYRHTFDVPLKNLLRSVDALKVLQGTVQFPLPTEVATLKFDPLKAGTEKTAGQIKMKLKQVNDSSVSAEFEGAELNDIQLVGYDAQEKLLDQSGRSGFGSGGKGSLNVQFEGELASLEARIPTTSHQVIYDFSLPEIPLGQHVQMPEKIESLQYTGDAPVTFEFARFAGTENFRKVALKATNHANKDVQNLQLDVAYLDAGGKTLKESPNNLTGKSLAKNATVELEVPAFFMPKETKSVSAVLQRARFVDASVWDRDDVFTAEQVPYVIGSATLDLNRSDGLLAGYVGLDREGKWQMNVAGVGSVSASSRPTSMKSTSFKPRITQLRIQDGTLCKFSHVKMVPGTYLVYLRRGERNCAWQWTEINADTKLDLKFEIRDTPTATLEVLLPSDADVPQVELIPLDDNGSTPIPDSDLAKAHLGSWLGTNTKPEAGKAIFDGLRPGKYRILAGPLQANAEAVADKTVTAKLTDSNN